MDCERLAGVMSLERDNQDSGRYLIIVEDNGSASLCEQQFGQPATASITIPRRHFLRLIEFYQTEQSQ
jgi:hypothetical protein